jgi:hypothetical protein
MRALVIDEQTIENVNRCVANAAIPDNYFVPGAGWIPGNNEAFVVHIPHGYRCVFTYSLVLGKVYRQLSISVDHPTLYPNPQSAVAIARLFGFTGGSENDFDMSRRIENDHWLVKPVDSDHCVVLAQEMEVGRA